MRKTDNEYTRNMAKRYGSICRGLREHEGLTQTQIGEVCGVRQKNVSDFENGKHGCFAILAFWIERIGVFDI